MTTSHKSLILFLHTPSCFVYSYHLFMQASFKFCKFSRQESWSEVAIPFSSGSPWPRDQSQISCIAGRFFTIGATKEAPRMREWLAIPFSRGQTDTEIEPRSPALKEDSFYPLTSGWESPLVPWPVTKPAFPALPGRFLTIINQGSPNNIYYMRPLLRAALVA